MNTLKRTLALVATLALSATAFASCGSDAGNSVESKVEDAASKVEDAASDAVDAVSDAVSDAVDPVTPGEIDASVGKGGDTFTVAAWDANDVPALLAQWKGNTDYKAFAQDLADGKVEGINFINFGVGGGEASEKYDNLFKGGDDLDVYFCEADWALKYINDDTKTLALEKLGITSEDFPNIFSYTDDIGTSNDGTRKGISWQAAAGGFGYRADLAEQYLGVKTPEEMQAKIDTWDKFCEAAKTVSDASNGKTALADTLGGLWQAYACGRTQPWVKDNQLLIDDFCKDFAETAKTLWDCGGVTKNTQWTDEWKAAGQNDTCMGYFVSTWGFGGFFLDAAGGVDGSTYGKWAVCQGPESFYWGGTWIVVNPATDNGEEARDFILSATSDEKQLAAYAVNKPEFVNNSKVMADLIDAKTVFNEDITNNLGGQNFYAELAENAKQIDFKGLITPYDATVKTEFINAVKEEYLEGSGDWDKTVEKFKDNVSEQLTDLDID